MACEDVQNGPGRELLAVSRACAFSVQRSRYRVAATPRCLVAANAGDDSVFRVIVVVRDAAHRTVTIPEVTNELFQFT